MGVLVRELGALYAAFREGHLKPAAGAGGPVRRLRRLAAPAACRRASWNRSWPAGGAAGGDAAGARPADRSPAAGGPRRAGSGRRLCDRRRDARPGSPGLPGGTGSTLFMTLLAGVRGAARRYTGEDDLVVGTPIAGRTRVETEALIGLFVNTLALRVGAARGPLGTPDFVALLERVREATLAAYAPPGAAVRAAGRGAVAGARPEPPAAGAGAVRRCRTLRRVRWRCRGSSCTAMPVETGTAKFDLACTLTETAAGLSGVLEYSRDLFDAATIERLAGHFDAPAGGSGGTSRRRRLSELPLLSRSGAVAARWSSGTTPGSLPAQRHPPRLFEAQAMRTPEAVALVSGAGERWTYGELDRRGGRCWRASCASLRRSGPGGAGRGVCLEPATPLLVAALLAVLQGGRRLRAARSGLPWRAARLHAGGQRGARCW